MNMTLDIDPNLIAKAIALTGVQDKATLVRMGLESLIARESARQLAALGGTEPGLKSVSRRRPGKAK